LEFKQLAWWLYSTQQCQVQNPLFVEFSHSFDFSHMKVYICSLKASTKRFQHHLTIGLQYGARRPYMQRVSYEKFETGDDKAYDIE
jgi:hypothetical protein